MGKEKLFYEPFFSHGRAVNTCKHDTPPFWVQILFESAVSWDTCLGWNIFNVMLHFLYENKLSDVHF